MKLTLPASTHKAVPAATTEARTRVASSAPRNGYRFALRCLFAFAPAAYMLFAIYNYSVRLPVIDEWDLTPLFEKFAQGTLTIADLFAQQNEYRQFFPNLIFVALAWLTKWDVRAAMLVSFLLSCLISSNVYQLCKLTFRTDRTERWWLYCLANLLIFSPMQYENWLQGQQLIYYMPVACVTSCLLIAYADRFGSLTKWLLCAVLSFVSTFSSANGFLCWLVVGPVLWQTLADSTLPRRRVWLLAWLAALAGSVALYLRGYHSPPNHPALTHALTWPLQACIYFLSLLGGPFGFSRLVLTVLCGALLLALFACACWQQRHALRQPAIARPYLCWLMLGAYSLLTAGLITVGRAGFGLEQSLAHRYVTYTLYLPIALVFLLAPALHVGQPQGTRLLARVRPILLAALVVLHAGLYLLSVKWMSGTRTTTRHAQACLQFINLVPDDACLSLFYSGPPKLRLRANALNRLGLLSPPLLTSDFMRDLSAANALPPEAYGALTGITQTGGAQYTATGQAMLPHRHEPADAVLLAWAGGGQEPRVFAIADVAVTRDFVSALARRGIYNDPRWRKTFSLASLPPGQLTITAYAFDARAGKAYKLAGAQVIQRNGE